MSRLADYGTEVARWVKGSDALVLVHAHSGKTLFLRRAYRGVPFKPVHIPIPGETRTGRRFSERPTLDQAEAFALRNGYERKPS